MLNIEKKCRISEQPSHIPTSTSSISRRSFIILVGKTYSLQENLLVNGVVYILALKTPHYACFFFRKLARIQLHISMLGSVVSNHCSSFTDYHSNRTIEEQLATDDSRIL